MDIMNKYKVVFLILKIMKVVERLSLKMRKKLKFILMKENF